MAEIDKLTSGNVTINTGKKVSGVFLPKNEEDDFNHIGITVEPGKTTARKLQSTLKYLKIKNIAQKDLENIAGGNKIFDSREELNKLDDYLEEKVILSELCSSDVDAGWALTPEKAQDKEYLQVLLDLRKLGAKVDDRLIYYLTPAKAKDFSYILRLEYLQRSGIKVDGEVIEHLDLEKAKNTLYLWALMALHKSGVNIDGKVIESLSLEKAKNPAYILKLKEFCKSGLEISGPVIDYLTLEKAQNITYFQALNELQRSGIIDKLKTGSVMIDTAKKVTANWSLNIGNDPSQRLRVTINPGKTTAQKLQIQLNQIKVNYIDLGGLKQITGKNKKYDGKEELEELDSYLEKGITFFELSSKGIDTSLLFPEKREDKVYIQALKDLRKSGIKVDRAFIASLDLEQAKDSTYIQVIKDFRKSGAKVDGPFIAYLTLEKCKSPGYIQTLRGLQIMGIEINGNIIAHFSIEKANDKDYMSALLHLHVAGVNINGYVIEQLYLEIAKDTACIKGLIELQKSGINLDSYVINRLCPEKAKHSPYIQTLKVLQRSGIEVDGSVIDALTLQKAKDNFYIERLKNLQRLDIRVSGPVIDYLTLEKAQNDTYFQIIKGLQESGIIDKLETGSVMIDESKKLSAESLPKKDNNDFKHIRITIESGKTTAKQLRNQLDLLKIVHIDLEALKQIAGKNKVFDSKEELEKLDDCLEESVTFSEISEAGIDHASSLTLLYPEKMADKAYIWALKDLKKSGIKVDENFCRMLSLEEAEDPAYIQALKDLQASGINVNGALVYELTMENAKNPAYMQALKDLHGSGIIINSGFVKNFNSEMAQNTAFIEALNDLHKLGINIDGEIVDKLYFGEIINDIFCNKATDLFYFQAIKNLHRVSIKIDGKVIESLTFAKARDKRYIQTLEFLNRNGINVDGWVIHELTPDKAKDTEYCSALLELNRAGVEVDFSLIERLTIEKAKDPIYFQALEILNKRGVNICGSLIDSLTPEKAKDFEYIQLLIDLQKLGINVDFDIIDNLTSEKAKKTAYIQTLKRLQESHIKVDGSFIGHLTIEKANNEYYIKQLIAGKGDFDYADSKYLKKKTGKNIDQINNTKKISKITKLYRKYSDDEIAEPLVFEILSKKMLPLAQKMNELHDSSDKERIKVIKELSAEDLYQLIIYAHEEVYTSTFRCIYERLRERMGKKLNAYSLIKKADPQFRDFRIVMGTCATYDRLKDFLSTISDSRERDDLFKRLIAGLRLSKNKIMDSICIAELMRNENDSDMLKQAEQYLLEAYESAKDPEEKILYSIIGAIYYTSKRFIQNESQLATFQAFALLHPINPYAQLSQNELVNANNEIVEQQFFYNDKDGENSFNAFYDQYESGSWKKEDKKSYVVLTKGNGVKIKIYANKPQQEQGIKDIQREFERKNLRPVIIVHRGHSYHVKNTIENIPSIARIVYLGSCGGYDNVHKVLNKAKGAQIISTKGRGTWTINEPLLKNINEATLQPVLKWEEIWRKTEKQISNKEDFKSYIPPYNNTASQLINAYNTFSAKFSINGTLGILESVLRMLSKANN